MSEVTIYESAGGGVDNSDDHPIKRSCVNMCFGVLFLVLSVVILIYNEHALVANMRALDEVEKQVVPFPTQALSDPVTAEATAKNIKDGTIIHIVANLEGHSITDPELGVSVSDAVLLRRHVEVLQWVERTETTNNKRKYTYVPSWSSSLVDPSTFRKRPVLTPPNPHSFTVYDATFPRDPQVPLGPYRLKSSLISKLPRISLSFKTGDHHPISSSLALPSHARLVPRHEYLHLKVSPPVPPPRPPRPALGAGVGSSAPGGPKESTSQLQQTTKPPVYSQSTDTVGDHRISYIVTPAQTISVIAQVERGSLSPIYTAAGVEVAIVAPGRRSISDTLAFQANHDSFVAWLIRFVGSFLSVLAFYALLSPLAAVLHLIPLIGPFFAEIVDTALVLVALPLGLSVASLTIALTWLYVRPLVSIAFLVGAIIPIAWLYSRKVKKD